jgi:hypothetical protein
LRSQEGILNDAFYGTFLFSDNRPLIEKANVTKMPVKAFGGFDSGSE